MARSPVGRFREGSRRALRHSGGWGVVGGALLLFVHAACDQPRTSTPGRRSGEVPRSGSTAEQTPTVRVALHEHLRSVLARSSVRLDPAELGDAAVVMLTEPTSVVYDDPRRPGHKFVLGTGRFVAINQAAGWVYGVNATPQDRATTIQETFAVARRLERDIAATAWERDTAPPWRATDDTIAVWVRGEDEALPIARFTAGPAEVVITLERTGAPTPSERLLGKTAETFYVNVGITDMSRLEAYQARVLRARRARGSGAEPLRLSAFMADTTPP